MVSTTLPPLKSSIVGIARIPYSAPIASFSSMFTLVILTLPSSSVASSSRIGAIALQGPHQGAQKSTSTGVAAAVTVGLKGSVVRFVIFSDMVVWMKGQENGREANGSPREGFSNDVGQLFALDFLN